MNQAAILQPPHRTYVAVEHVEKFLAYGRRIGAPVDALLADYQIDLRRDTDKPGYVPGPIWEGILAMGIKWCQRLGDPLPGLHIAEALGISFTGLWAFVIETSGTFEQAIDKAATYQKLHTTTVTASARRSPGYLDIIFSPHFREEEVRHQSADWYLAMLALFAQHCCDNVADLVHSVNVEHSAPPSDELRQRYISLFNCPVNFNADDNFIRLHARALNRPLITADPAVQSALEQQARQKLDAYNRDSCPTEASIRKQLRQLLAEGQACKERLAQSLCMSPRTLQRKLQGMGISYQQLLNEVRLSEAETLLRQSPMPISRIASQLGFSDPPSFSRWFSGQVGEAPSRYRSEPA